VEEENAHSEFKEHGEDEPDEADREESASGEVSKPGDEEIDDHENQKGTGEGADLREGRSPTRGTRRITRRVPWRNSTTRRTSEMERVLAKGKFGCDVVDMKLENRK
jgi:hypothetical protein